MGAFQRRMHWVFLGPQGVRPGWRVLTAIGLFVLFVTVLSAALMRIPAARARMAHGLSGGAMTAEWLLLSEALSVLALALSALVMTKIEKRSFADYGLPGRGAWGKRFWQGAAMGLLMVSLLMGLIAALHGFAVSGWAVGGVEAVRYAVLYLLACLLVGVFEEFSFRGYLQATLSQAIHFWPAAAVLAVLFGVAHLRNPGEAGLGALMAGSFGLLAAFTLRRTGNLWFAIGMHASWDWGETYFYSVPNSGVQATGHLMNSTFHGPAWLTGGTVGPEGSVFAFVVLALWALIVHYMFPAKPETP
jgi:membrane protease YdiL (CAAX protease family)